MDGGGAVFGRSSGVGVEVACVGYVFHLPVMVLIALVNCSAVSRRILGFANT